MKRIVCFLMIFIFALSLTGCTENKLFTPYGYRGIKNSTKPDGELIAENNSYRLLWDETDLGISLQDKKTGTVWGTTPELADGTGVDEYGVPIKRNPQLLSSVIIEYLSSDLKQEKTAISYTAVFKNGKIKTKKIKNGIRVEYYFSKEKIMVPIEYVLREDSIAVNFNPKKIREGKNLLLSVGIAPFWCCGENDAADSYLFIPSGSGALIDCETVSQQGTKAKYQMYGDDSTMQKQDSQTNEEKLSLPVYGSKSGNKGCCAIIEKAAECSVINTMLGSSQIKYSTIYASYQLRGYTSNVAAVLYNESQKRDVYANEIATMPMTVGFYPLSGDRADYVGMADTYKNFLKEKGDISAIKEDDTLCLTFVGGTMVDKFFFGVPYKTMLAATTLEDVKNILSEIVPKSSCNINVKLLGFGETGIDVSSYGSSFKISKSVGNKKDLTALSKYCEENGIGLFFDFDLIRFSKGGYGFNTFSDVAYNACKKVAVGYSYDIATRSRIEDKSFYLLSRDKLSAGAEKLQKKIKRWDLNGVSLSTLSSMAYSDYSDKKSNTAYGKGNISNDVQSIAKSFGEKYDVAVTNANAYAAVCADVIYQSPLNSSKHKSFMCDIPFYQMVFKGYVPLSGNSLNLAEDRQKTVLSCIESGCGLDYTLTSNYHTDFINSVEPYFYGTVYDDLKETVFADLSQYKDYYTAVKGAEISAHTVLENGIRKTDFSNGTVVYVNYSNEKKDSPFGEVDACSYLWR